MNQPEARNGRSSPQPGPFGYSFLSPMNTPYEPAPAPPPGPALLDDNESNMLNDFFTTMNSNQFSNDFWLNQPNKPMGGAPAFEWSDELPPTFEGSATSLHPSGHPHRSQEKPGMGMLPNGAAANPDIFAAASMLYQNGMGPAEYNPSFGQPPFPTYSDMDMHPRISGRGKEPQHHDMSAKPPNASSQNRLPVAFHTSEMLFDVREPISPEQQATAKVRPLHWGSDISFMDQGYVAPPDQPDEETRTKELLRNLESLEPQSSAANTRAPSPERTHGHHPASWAEQQPGGGPAIPDIRREYRQSLDDITQPNKRQKTHIKEEEDDSDDDDDLTHQRRHSKSSATYTPKSRRLSTDSIRKSRLQPGAKAARENLTEEQKRNNHILSEQKRRNLIRQGFDDLCTLVPGLRGGGFSKSAMLTQAADWLEEVLRGNEILKAQLADMKAMNGLVMPR